MKSPSRTQLPAYTSKADREAFWGAVGRMPSMDAILSACRQLETDGITINRDNVRSLTGITFTNQLAAGIALYRTRKDIYSQAPEVPAVIVETVLKSLAEAYSACKQEADRSIESAGEGFTFSLAEADSENARLADMLKGAHVEIEHLAIALRQRDETIGDHNRQLEQITNVSEKLAGELQALALSQHRVKRLLSSRRRRTVHVMRSQEIRQSEREEQHQVRMREVTESHDKVLDRLYLQLDNMRTDAKKAAMASSNEVKELLSRVAELQKATSRLEAEALGHAKAMLVKEDKIRALEESNRMLQVRLDESQANAKLLEGIQQSLAGLHEAKTSPGKKDQNVMDGSSK